ncbi:MAG: class I SAM-dependent methyltransferase [Dysgonamonadaceae bacterium]|nr:class I SAM-dependent methyltransferase [Dysgonamonadaceae bacterium]
MDRYYPDNYYSFSLLLPKKWFFYPYFMKVKNFLLKNLVKYRLENKNNFIGFLASKRYHRYYYLNEKMCHINSKILDVGCGAGQLLLDMKKHGFKNLKGIDPYISSDITYDSGVKIEKKYINELNETFDFIMLHHSFEHMDNPESVMKEIYRLLNPNAYALIRIPVARSYAYKKYGAYWVQLDAPRHFFIHSTASMQYLAKKAGLELESIVYDSTSFQFIGSEQYLKGENISFKKKEIKYFSKKAKQLNAISQGDQACFYLKK